MERKGAIGLKQYRTEKAMSVPVANVRIVAEEPNDGQIQKKEVQQARLPRLLHFNSPFHKNIGISSSILFTLACELYFADNRQYARYHEARLHWLEVNEMLC